MESNWRLNVWQYGLSLTGIRLVGIFPTPTGRWIGITDDPLWPTNRYGLLLSPTPGIPDAPYLVLFGGFSEIPHFPYGFDVLPDANE